MPEPVRTCPNCQYSEQSEDQSILASCWCQRHEGYCTSQALPCSDHRFGRNTR